MEPDRWEEERRRGLTIDLGFAWTTLPSGREVAFVDVPGHQRFLGNTLAGLGPAPVVCFVVAADEGWQAQSSDHRDAVAALGIRHGLIVITRADRAPERAAEVLAQARAELAETGLRDAPGVIVSAVDGTGLTELRAALDRVLAQVPRARDHGPVAAVGRSFLHHHRRRHRGDRDARGRHAGPRGPAATARRASVCDRGDPRSAEPRRALPHAGTGGSGGAQPARRLPRRHPPRRRAGHPRCMAEHPHARRAPHHRRPLDRSPGATHRACRHRGRARPAATFRRRARPAHSRPAAAAGSRRPVGVTRPGQPSNARWCSGARRRPAGVAATRRQRTPGRGAGRDGRRWRRRGRGGPSGCGAGEPPASVGAAARRSHYATRGGAGDRWLVGARRDV